MELLVKRAQSDELSGADINRMLRGSCPIIPYSKLSQYNNIDDVLGPNQCAVILYEMIENEGHWTCIFRNKKGRLVFYDSLGYPMDSELVFVNKYRKKNDMPTEQKELTRLVGNEKVISNTESVQEDKANISTCGRFSVMRLLLRDLSNKQFNDIFMNDEDYKPDFFATLVTMLL